MNEEEKKEMQEYLEKKEKVEREIAKRIVGLSNVIKSLFICFFTHGERDLIPHILITSWVGEGKTVLSKTFAQAMKANYERIQFHAQMMPYEVLEVTEMLEDGSFQFQPGPVRLAHILLADEINRASERAGSNFLEAMGEGQATIGTDTYSLKEPFFVIATKNPIEVEATFELGQARLDRFMMQIDIEDLSEEEEVLISEMQDQKAPKIVPVLTMEEVLKIREFIREKIYISRPLRYFAVRIVRALRVGGGIVTPEELEFWPKGKRGYNFLQRGAKVKAFLEGRDFVLPEDIEELAYPILSHRLKFKYIGGNPRELISKAIKKVIKDEGIKGP